MEGIQCGRYVATIDSIGLVEKMLADLGSKQGVDYLASNKNAIVMVGPWRAWELQSPSGRVIGMWRIRNCTRFEVAWMH